MASLISRKSRMVTGFFVILLSGCFVFTNAFAKNNPLVGDWVTISDKTHARASIVAIREINGKFYGKVKKIFEQGGNKPTDLCVECSGGYHNKRIMGMYILFDMVERSPGYYADGKILDPKSGNVYRCQITILKNGQLKVRGYIGFSLFGRSQIWLPAKSTLKSKSSASVSAHQKK